MSRAAGRRWAGQAIAPPYGQTDPNRTPRKVREIRVPGPIRLHDWIPERVSEGTRTPDRLDHNQELYQLSYAHRGLSM